MITIRYIDQTALSDILSYLGTEEAAHYLQQIALGESRVKGHVWPSVASIYRCLGYRGTDLEIARKIVYPSQLTEAQLATHR